MPSTSDFDIVMIGPFPTDERRIEGGVQASVHGLVRHLVASDEVGRLEVISTPRRVGGPNVETRMGGVPVLHVSAPLWVRMSVLLRVPMILRRIGRVAGRVVHLHGSGPFELLILAGCRLARVPIVWTLHGITEKETLEAWRRRPGVATYLRHLMYKVSERLQLWLAPILIVDTAYVAREIAGRAHAQPSALPQGIDVDEFATARDGERQGRLVVSIGVIHPRKGHDRTIAAFAEVARRVPNARLEVIGSLSDAAHLEELHAAIRHHRLEDRVAIHTDLDRAELLEALGRARVFALHSEEESQGIALCEAMAAGVPIVATAVGGIPDVIGTSGAGRLVAFGDVDGFAEAIVDLLGDETEWTRTREAALIRARDFDWSNIVRGVLERYRLARDGRDHRRRTQYPDVRPARSADRHAE